MFSRSSLSSSQYWVRLAYSNTVLCNGSPAGLALISRSPRKLNVGPPMPVVTPASTWNLACGSSTVHQIPPVANAVPADRKSIVTQIIVRILPPARRCPQHWRRLRQRGQVPPLAAEPMQKGRTANCRCQGGLAKSNEPEGFFMHGNDSSKTIGGISPDRIARLREMEGAAFREARPR